MTAGTPSDGLEPASQLRDLTTLHGFLPL
jgi:hypothetical protein